MEQLSLTLPGKDTTVQEATLAAELAICYLQRQRKEEASDAFYMRVTEGAKEMTASLALPRHKQPPKRHDDGSSSHQFSTLKYYFRRQYYEVLDLIVSELKMQFQHERGMPVAAMIEKVIVDAANGTSESVDLPKELQLYEKDLDLARLKVQLQMVPDLITTRNKKLPNMVPITKMTNLRALCDAMNEVSMSKDMVSEVRRLLQIFYTIPVKTSTAEQTFSALRRLKNYLRSTMSQPRLNHTMINK